ncbi:unnamed protein product [Prorocentrum cordatum]|uniref:Uncharacterized protein n=1 Tax=Prorocentrum cordatum TaxID=2364126 RepID=A0ABN9YDW0_9DINO|nr:unnamed protein product [Polarella glacialis]
MPLLVSHRVKSFCLLAQSFFRSKSATSRRSPAQPAPGARQCWETDDACMWVHAPSGESWFEYRLVAYIDFPLRHCLVPLHERDLIIKYQPVFTEPHREIGPQGKHYAVVRTLSKILAFYIEMGLRASARRSPPGLDAAVSPRRPPRASRPASTSSVTSGASRRVEAVGL